MSDRISWQAARLMSENGIPLDDARLAGVKTIEDARKFLAILESDLPPEEMVKKLPKPLQQKYLERLEMGKTAEVGKAAKARMMPGGAMSAADRKAVDEFLKGPSGKGKMLGARTALGVTDRPSMEMFEKPGIRIEGEALDLLRKQVGGATGATPDIDEAGLVRYFDAQHELADKVKGQGRDLVTLEDAQEYLKKGKASPASLAEEAWLAGGGTGPPKGPAKGGGSPTTTKFKSTSGKQFYGEGTYKPRGPFKGKRGAMLDELADTTGKTSSGGRFGKVVDAGKGLPGKGWRGLKAAWKNPAFKATRGVAGKALGAAMWPLMLYDVYDHLAEPAMGVGADARLERMMKGAMMREDPVWEEMGQRMAMEDALEGMEEELGVQRVARAMDRKEFKLKGELAELMGDNQATLISIAESARRTVPTSMEDALALRGL